MEDWSWLDVDSEDVLVKSLVHALEHGIMLCVFTLNGEILLNTLDTFDSHVLSDFHGIGAPWGNHLSAWTYKESFQVFFALLLCFSVEPAKFICLF